MNQIGQLVIVIGIIVLFLYLVNKVIRLVVKLALIGIGIVIIFSLVSLFSVQNQIGEVDKANLVLVLTNKTTPITIIESYEDKIRTLNEDLNNEFNPKEFKSNSTVVVINQEIFKGNESKYKKLHKLISEKEYPEIYSEIINFINETSFIKLTYFYFKGDIRIYPRTKINDRYLTLKNTTSLPLKILKMVKI